MNQFVRLALKSFLRELLAYHVIRHHSDGTQPLFLYASRRGGSTALSEAIAAGLPTLYVDQPFSVFTTPHYYFRNLVGRPYGPLTTECGLESPLYDYIDGIINARLRPGITINPRHTGFRLRTSRVLATITDAQALAPWISSKFDIRAIVLLRHPIPQARSVQRAGWPAVGAVFLRDVEYINRHLTLEQLTVAREIYKAPQKFEAFLLDWILEHLPIFHSPCDPKQNLNLIYYEDMVENPQRLLSSICPDMSPDGMNKALKSLSKASRSTQFSTKERRNALRQTDKKAIISGWTNQIDSENRKRAQALLTLFQIRHYSIDSAYPER